MNKQEEIYRYWTENSGLDRETAINNAMRKFKITWATARTYYPKWRKQFMKTTTLVVDKPKPAVVNKDFDKLFDKFLITFNENGNIIWSHNRLDEDTRIRLIQAHPNLEELSIIINNENQTYIEYHRAVFNQKEEAN